MKATQKAPGNAPGKALASGPARDPVIAFGKALVLALLLGGAASMTHAETLIVNDQVTVAQPSIATPGRGLTMAQVEKKFGAPTERHAAVGKPPITRWDYPGFSVFFEHQWVIHSVAAGS